MKIYTRGGDTGGTSLLGGDRVSKHHPRIEAYGTIDELNSVVGVIRTHRLGELDSHLERVQNDLFDIGAQLAAPGHEAHFGGVADDRIEALEHAIDGMESELEPLKNFILPGGSPAAAHLHVARTVCRRAERAIVALEDVSPVMLRTIRYVNRLSDYLFVAARYANHLDGVQDVAWKR